MSRITVSKDAVAVSNLVTNDPEVVSFFTEASEESRPELAAKAISLGVAGLKAMGVAGRVEVVEKEFLKLTQGFDKTLGDLESRLLERVESTFDPNEKESVSARIGLTITDAYKAAEQMLDGVRKELSHLVSDSFNPELTTSCVYRIVNLITETRADLDKAFDPAVEGSHVSRLARLIDDYFGNDGSISQAISLQVTPVKDEVMRGLLEIRDLIVGQSAAANARRLSPASGQLFEDEVEETLRVLAKAYGDSVDRVGTVGGDAGGSRKGDFRIELREGAAFVVEAKDYSSPVTLRGPRGILANLDQSMQNRNASFAIAVMKEEDGFPKEVGRFNDYGGTKILCAYGQDGELLETAYRWARTAALAIANEKLVDVTTVEAGLDEVRQSLREIARIEAKAKAISKGAEEIETLIKFQLRRANAGLDEAASGLLLSLEKAS